MGVFSSPQRCTTMEEVLMEEVLSDTSWTSAGAIRVELLRIHPVMCGSAFTSAHRHHHLDRLVHLVVSLEQTDFGDATSMEELTVEARWLLPPLCFFQLHRQVRFDVCFSWHVVHRCV